MCTTLRAVYHEWSRQQNHPVREYTNSRWLNHSQIRFDKIKVQSRKEEG